MPKRLHKNRVFDWHKQVPNRARQTLFAIVAALCTTFPAVAQTAAEHSSMRIAIERFETSFEAGNYEALLTAMPPRLLERIATQAGIAPDALRTQLVTQMTAMMSQMTLESFNMDVATAQWGQTSTGLTYALVPTQTVMTPPGSSRVRSTTTTLALNEDDTWYLLRIDNGQQMDLLVQVYPEFSDVSFPTGTMEVLD